MRGLPLGVPFGEGCNPKPESSRSVRLVPQGVSITQKLYFRYNVGFIYGSGRTVGKPETGVWPITSESPVIRTEFGEAWLVRGF